MANTGSGLVAPNSFPIRHPTDNKQAHGRIVNPPRFPEIGGFDGPQSWNAESGRPHGNPQKNIARVEKATNTKGAHKVAD